MSHGSLNDCLSIARSGILAHQQRMAVISHNIANINTPGYHRQKTVLGTNPPEQSNVYSSIYYDIGTGVRVMDVVRAYNDAMERQYLNLNSSATANSLLSNTLAGIESMLNSTVDGVSLTDYLAKFWAAWQDVATNPTNTAMRTVLLEKAATLTYAFNSMATNLDNYTADLITGSGSYTGMIQTTVDEINSLATRIQDLNVQITAAKARSTSTNDLCDQRNELIRELSSKAGITIDADQTIRINNQMLVSGDGTMRNDLAISSASPEVTFSLDAYAVTISGGELDGYVQACNIITTLRSNLDTLANELITDINQWHQAGFDLNGDGGVDFFIGDGADDIQVSPALYNYSNPLLGHPELVAAAMTLDPGPPPIPNVGDGSNALRIADLGNTNLFGLGERTCSEYFTDMTAAVGASKATAEDLANNNQIALDAYANIIQETDGVNLDEELLDMMSAQRAFAAASRVATTVDEMMQVLLNI